MSETFKFDAIALKTAAPRIFFDENNEIARFELCLIFTEMIQ